MFLFDHIAHRYSSDFPLSFPKKTVIAATGGWIPCQPNVYQVPKNGPWGTPIK